MSTRPVLTKSNSGVKINIPARWSFTFSAISYAGYNQLIRIRYTSVDGGKNTQMLESPKWGRFNEVMKFLGDESQSMVLVPSDNPIDVELDFFFSKQRGKAGKDIAKDEFAVAGVQSRIVDRPGFQTKIPDYMSISLLVQDDKNDNPQKYRDAMATVNLEKVDSTVAYPSDGCYAITNVSNLYVANPKTSSVNSAIVGGAHSPTSTHQWNLYKGTAPGFYRMLNIGSYKWAINSDAGLFLGDQPSTFTLVITDSPSHFYIQTPDGEKVWTMNDQGAAITLEPESEQLKQLWCFTPCNFPK